MGAVPFEGGVGDLDQQQYVIRGWVGFGVEILSRAQQGEVGLGFGEVAESDGILGADDGLLGSEVLTEPGDESLLLPAMVGADWGHFEYLAFDQLHASVRWQNARHADALPFVYGEAVFLGWGQHGLRVKVAGSLCL